MLDVGTFYRENQSCLFRVWAPLCKQMTLHLVHPDDQKIEMSAQPGGYFVADVPNLSPATLYYYQPDEQGDYPDPASHYQPEGVHRASKVVNHHAFSWNDQTWTGVNPESLVIYELHVGTFTTEGTFEAIIPRLQDLKEIGVTALQLMPIAQFPGNRNWGYDGVYPYAVQNSYGGPDGLKKLVDAAHANGIAVLLDVVYNHLGPEGNYLDVFGPYFSDTYKTPWGKAINFDGPHSDGVREFFANNALYWARYFHIDGLRFDAIHEIFDRGAIHFWEFLNKKIEHDDFLAGKNFWLIAESDLNDPKVVQPNDLGGFGFTAQWLDDFHHALYVLVDQNGQEQYGDFGSLRQLQKAYLSGFVHSGDYVAARKKKYGRSSAAISGDHFIAFIQNHDQVGNRVKGERLSVLVDFDRLKLATGALWCAPYIPMLFMGEEYADETPFYYFVSHSDPELIAAVTEGRNNLFAALKAPGKGQDPQEIDTFKNSIIDWEQAKSSHHKVFREWTKKLARLKTTHPALKCFDRNNLWCDVVEQQGLALFRRSSDEQHLLLILMNFGNKTLRYNLPTDQKWGLLLDSTDAFWQRDYTGNDPATTASTIKTSFSLKPLQFVILEQQDQV